MSISAEVWAVTENDSWEPGLEWAERAIKRGKELEAELKRLREEITRLLNLKPQCDRLHLEYDF